ncbi:glycosyltransferase [Demequina iriomotensis]|uniref:glycosyltransferase n=1 Tax=Demequina iriomotensis TaxID=1536641 RepID=UPI000A5B7A42|nr:glycosyltransferase [Demequina iriomotensis]
MKIAIIGTRGYPSYYGGFETAVRKLAPFLADREHDVTVYGRRGGTKADDPTRDPRVRSIETPGIESSALSTLSHGLTAVLHALVKRPDAVLVMNVANGYWLPLLRLARIRTVVNVDGIEWERAKWSRLGKFVFRLGARLTATHATVLVVDSVEIGKTWEQLFGATTTFIPYGGEEVAELPLKDEFASGEYVLAVARFVPENTIEEFFDAAELIAAERPVVIVGSSGYGGPLDERAAALAERHANVHWLGHVSDDPRLFALWQHAGAYFHGHSVGGTNPALVQAMMCGAPVVARDTKYSREVLADSARFVKPVLHDIAEALSEVAQSREAQKALGSGARERALKHYNWQGVCEAYETALLPGSAHDVVGNGP